MNYKIKHTADLEFHPTEIDIIVGEKKVITEVVEDEQNDVEYIEVTSVLTQRGEKSQTQRATKHLFTYDLWQSIVTGYSTEKKEPILNEKMLNQIFAQFNIQLV